VLSASSPAAKLDCQLRDLQTRLNGIVGIETDRLSDRERLQALKLKATGHGFEFSDEVGRFILARAGRDMRSLVSIFEKLSQETLRAQRIVTIPFVKQILGL
jgi:DnaA family protein